MGNKKIYCCDCKHNLYNYMISQNKGVKFIPEGIDKNSCICILKDTPYKQEYGKCDEINKNNDCKNYVYRENN